MHVLFEFLPLILFLLAYFLKDIYFALGVLMVAMPIGLAVKFLVTKKLDRMYFWSTILLLVAGAATFYFNNPKFLYWKPTVFYWVIALVFLVSTWVGDRPMVKRFFDMASELPTAALDIPAWRKLNLVWVLFFAGMGAANIYVAYAYSEKFWVNFKVFGLMGITIIFMLGQSIWLFSKVSKSDAAHEEDTR